MEAEIRDVLLREWDPIGLGPLAPKDEYDAFIPELRRLLLAGADRLALAAELQACEAGPLGLGPTDGAKRLAVADRLRRVGGAGRSL